MRVGIFVPFYTVKTNLFLREIRNFTNFIFSTFTKTICYDKIAGNRASG